MKKLLTLLLAAIMLLGPFSFVTAEEPYTIKWVVVGGGMPKNYDTWKAKFDEYLAEKMPGTAFDVEVISWGAWGDKRNAMINSGEYFDIVFTNTDSFYTDIQKNALLDLTELLPKYAPKLYEELPEALWTAASVNGKIYAVPTYKDSSLAQYFIYDTAVVEATGINLDEIKDLADWEPIFLEMQKSGIDPPFVMSQEGVYQILDKYDNAGIGVPVIGVRYDDAERKVVSIFETEEIMGYLHLLHKWYNDGIINIDAATLKENPRYRAFYFGQGWHNAWPITDGKPSSDKLWFGPIFSNGTAQGSMNGISAACKDPERVLKFLELVNTDTKMRDMICYGEEGVNYTLTEDKLVVRSDDNSWDWPRYTQGNHFVLTPEASTPTQLEEIKANNDAATASVLLGFVVDRSNIQDEIDNINEVYNAYKAELLTGTGNPDELVPLMIEEMKNVGFEKVMEELAKQLEAHFAE
ncbi:MAG: ABC transporter substrate-binding protein [Eubacteriales bacterium]|nr:ABC transporter substrate-binding protein [Eubacteriales bacterium]